uniref:Uncharacterized protein n=1 Tax=Anticarsia gemmatalis multiple nucleopolyhedrovirus TaxID=268591 RepID=A0A0S3IY71_9ABAC|nr:hypothetical protein AGNV_012 [Anticarsia gemmatalis multiple nucleopolyhedrovirus]ALR72177.1 hypothetical protein AGNV_012 [Anticarsia gemmatalis multiple nucleopolyhedrovirus]
MLINISFTYLCTCYFLIANKLVCLKSYNNLLCNACFSRLNDRETQE